MTWKYQATVTGAADKFQSGRILMNPGWKFVLRLLNLRRTEAAMRVDAGGCIRQSRNIVTIEKVLVGNKVVLHVAGRMDAENAAQFERECESSIAEGLTTLVVDLGDLSYVSSLGLRSFVAVAKKLRDKGGDLKLCRLTGLVRQVFDITRLSQVFPPHDTLESALMEG